jgi:Amidohydrolase family
MNPSRSVAVSRCVALFAAMLFCAPVPSQDLLIRGAKVYTLSRQGTLNKADVLISEGKIAAIGENLEAPASVMIVEGNGRPLTPGLFAGISGIGLEEVSEEAATVDRSLKLKAPAWQLQWRPELDVTPAYNPRSVVVEVTRIEGFTWTVLGPGSGGDVLMAGQGRAVVLDGRFDAALANSQSLFVYLGGEMLDQSGGTRAAQYMLLAQAVQEARIGEPVGENALLHRAGRAVLAQYLRGGRVVFTVDRAADIRQVVALAPRYNIKPVISGGTEAWVVAQELASADVPVLLDPLENLPSTFDRIGARLDNAALLDRAGVRIAFTQRGEMDSHNARKVRQRAGNAVAHGLPWDKALAALTINAAEIFGQGANRGRIAAGLSADLVLWSGDPLEVTTMAEQVWITGRPIAMRSRQTELRDRYFNRSSNASLPK